jgi:hypothetical protein
MRGSTVLQLPPACRKVQFDQTRCLKHRHRNKKWAPNLSFANSCNKESPPKCRFVYRTYVTINLLADARDHLVSSSTLTFHALQDVTSSRPSYFSFTKTLAKLTIIQFDAVYRNK